MLRASPLAVAGRGHLLAYATKLLDSSAVLPHHRAVASQTTSPSPQKPGFRRKEYGLRWYPNKEELLNSAPGRVLVGASYEPRVVRGKIRSVRKYSSLPSHKAFYGLIREHQEQQTLHNLHEVFPCDQPRCLYFDLDGQSQLADNHSDIISWLSNFVHWGFSGDHLGWPEAGPKPVVLRSNDPRKYSCHVVFPQVQFRSHDEQSEYLTPLLNSLSALEVNLDSDESVPILERVVDRAPYSRWQLYRGPHASKLHEGMLRPETTLQPENYHQDDPLSCFAGYVEPTWGLRLPSVGEMLALNPELADRHKRHHQRVADAEPGRASPQDMDNLYIESFQQQSTGRIDFTRLTDVESFEAGLRLLHPDRASQWWSWFRLCGVTARMLVRYEDSPVTRRRIWGAHMQWSRSYPSFDEEENVEMVERSRGRASLDLLLSLVRFDNPGMQVQTPKREG